MESQGFTENRMSTFDPTPVNLPSLNEAHIPLSFELNSNELPDRSVKKMLITSAIVGAVLGLIVYIISASNYRLSYLLNKREINGFWSFCYCLVWGAVFGELLGLVASLLYKKMKYPYPAFALLLFTPFLMILLPSVYKAITTVVVGIVVVVVVIAVIYAFVAG